jgi:hypothetical protein
VRRNDPPLPRLVALLLVALAGLTLAGGGWDGPSSARATAPASESVTEEFTTGDAAAERRDVRAERRTRSGRGRRLRRRPRALGRRVAAMRRAPQFWRSAPLRGPPLSAV